jgi:hypothetical protein
MVVPGPWSAKCILRATYIVSIKLSYLSDYCDKRLSDTCKSLEDFGAMKTSSARNVAIAGSYPGTKRSGRVFEGLFPSAREPPSTPGNATLNTESTLVLGVSCLLPFDFSYPLSYPPLDWH